MNGAGMRSRWAGDAAFVVALFLLVQALFTGLASGARAGSLADDRPALICGAHGALPSLDAQGPVGPVRHLIDCCTLGCPMLGGGLPQSGPLPLRAARSRPIAGGRRLSARVAKIRAELSPRHPRAPPLA